MIKYKIILKFKKFGNLNLIVKIIFELHLVTIKMLKTIKYAIMWNKFQYKKMLLL